MLYCICTKQIQKSKVPFDCGHDQGSDIFLILQKQGGVRTYETAKQKSTAPWNPAPVSYTHLDVYKKQIEDKLVMAPEGMSFTAEEIADAVRFQEQYYDSEIEILKE